jgi:hypothetical protein
MTIEDFASAVSRAIVDENTIIYRRLFEQTLKESVKDPYWIEAGTFYAGLSIQQRETLFKIVRQVVVDTTSNVLGILDGTSHVDGSPRVDLSIDGHLVAGDLQDMFLAVQERSRRLK